MSIFRAAFVIARRDFAATVFSRAFLLFLLGPLFPVLVGAIFGGVGATVSSDAERPVVAFVGSADEFQALSEARLRLEAGVEPVSLVRLHHVDPGPGISVKRLLESRDPPIVAVMEGGLGNPRLSGPINRRGLVVRQMTLLVDDARHIGSGPPAPAIALDITERSAGSLTPARALTARAGQTILFLLTILLSGMLLSQLIEEKSNKVIEVLAAAVPIDAIFLGKLFAMLAMSLLGIAVWTAVGAAAIAIFAPNGLGALPPPALGWPAFLALSVIYFAMSYLLLGAVFLGIGAQASTVREVQTLSMPVTMAQVVLFALAATAVGHADSARALAAAAFPLSSPFVMIARAAEQPELWPHIAAIAWQVLWVALILRVASRFFRRSVLKSGPAGRRKPARA